MAEAHRKTRQRVERPHECRFLTFSCYGRLPLFSNDAIKDAFLEQLSSTRQTLNFQLVGYVVMPEHVHLTVVPSLPAAPVPRVLRHLKGAFAHRVLERWKDLDAPILSRLPDKAGTFHFWQRGGGYDRNIWSSDEYEEKLDYMHANPVARGLVSPTDWKWSSARWHYGLREGALPLDVVT